MNAVHSIPHVRVDLDRRIELVSMDRWCHDITIALYLVHDGQAATVHSYSGASDVPARLAWLAEAMAVLGGMEPAGDDGRTVHFTCGSWHQLAARRVFLEACKVDPTAPLRTRPLETNDARTAQYITVEPLGGGEYHVTAKAEDPAAASRAPAVAAGLVKLAGLTPRTDDTAKIQFACGASHDALVGLLLPRAINVRATLRELEEAAGRGLLLAPSAQDAAAGAA